MQLKELIISTVSEELGVKMIPQTPGLSLTDLYVHKSPEKTLGFQVQSNHFRIKIVITKGTLTIKATEIVYVDLKDEHSINEARARIAERITWYRKELITQGVKAW